MKEYQKIIIDSYSCSSLNWKFIVKEINIMVIIFGILPITPLALAINLINSIWIAAIILLLIVLHYAVYYFYIREKLSYHEIKYKDYFEILNIYLIETSKYWTKSRFHIFINTLENKSNDEKYSAKDVIDSTYGYIKKSVETIDRKEKIVINPRRSLMLWLLAPIIGIFSAIFQNLTKSAIDHPIMFLIIFLLAYIFTTFIFIVFEIIKKEYNSDYQKLELLNFMECALILLDSEPQGQPPSSSTAG